MSALTNVDFRERAIAALDLGGDSHAKRAIAWALLYIGDELSAAGAAVEGELHELNNRPSSPSSTGKGA